MRVLAVGQWFGLSNRIVRMWCVGRGWRIKDSTGYIYKQELVLLPNAREDSGGCMRAEDMIRYVDYHKWHGNVAVPRFRGGGAMHYVRYTSGRLLRTLCERYYPKKDWVVVTQDTQYDGEWDALTKGCVTCTLCEGRLREIVAQYEESIKGAEHHASH